MISRSRLFGRRARYRGIAAINDFWSGRTRGRACAPSSVCGAAEGCPWQRVLFRETDLFWGCLTLKWYVPGIQKGLELVELEGSWDKEETRWSKLRLGMDQGERPLFALGRKKEGMRRSHVVHGHLHVFSIRLRSSRYGGNRDTGRRGREGRTRNRGGRLGEKRKKQREAHCLGAVGGVLSNGPSSSTKSFSPQYPTPCSVQSVPSLRRDAIVSWAGTHDLEAQPATPAPTDLSLPTFVRHFSSGTLARQSYSPFRHYVCPRCSIPSIWPRYIRSPSLIFLSCFFPLIRPCRVATPRRFLRPFRTRFVLQRRVKSDWKMLAPWRIQKERERDR